MHKFRQKYIGDKAFYKRYLMLAIPMIIQNAITNLVSFLDNIMVGQLGTEQMSGVAIVNQLIFVYNLAVFGAVSAASIFGAQYFGKGNHKGHMYSFRFKLYAALLVTAIAMTLFITNGTGFISLYLTDTAGNGATEVALAYGKEYLEIVMIGLIPFAVTQAYATNIKETGQTFVPMVYQSGYITIKNYDEELDLYTLNIPNKEVRIGLMKSLLPHYVGSKAPETTTMVAYLSRDIRNGDMDTALRRLQTFLSTIPQCDNTKYEGHYQQVFYIIFSLLGYYVDVEVRTPRGRVDIVLRTKTTLYVMELKLDKSAGEAMEQIDLKNYPERFALCGLPVVKVAVSFDSERCTIGDWKIINA